MKWWFDAPSTEWWLNEPSDEKLLLYMTWSEARKIAQELSLFGLFLFISKYRNLAIGDEGFYCTIKSLLKPLPPLPKL